MKTKTIEIERNPPKSSVRKFTRGGDTYTALYDPNGTLARLMNTTTHQEVPGESQTFRRLADGNRGSRFKEVPHTEYVVVLAHKKSAGAYAGVRTIEPYSSKDEFDTWFKKSGRKQYDIVAQGVSMKEATRLCERQPLRNLVRAAVGEATDKDGFVNPGIAHLRMMNVMLHRGGNLMPF